MNSANCICVYVHMRVCTHEHKTVAIKEDEFEREWGIKERREGENNVITF